MGTSTFIRAAAFFVAAALSATSLAEPFFTDDFMGKKTKWETRLKHGRGLKIEFGARGRNFTGLIVSSSQKELDKKDPNVSDTCWGVRTPPIPLPEKRKPYLLVSFDVAPDLDLEATREGCHGAYNAVIWYDASGKEVQYATMRFRAKAGDFRTIRKTFPVPADARSVSVQVGFGEDLYEGVTVAYKDLKVDMADSAIPTIGRIDRGDFRPPKVRMLSASPTFDQSLKPSFRVTDETGVDWKTLKVEIDGTNVTERFAREGDVVTWQGAANWAKGHHYLAITVADTKGQSYRHRRCFYIGATPQVPKITVRDDGVTLIDGKPFFPIGIFGVRLMAGHNGNSYDNAIRELKEAGFNTVHSYGECRAPGFVAAAKKHGMWMWTNEELSRWEFREQERFWPHVLAWYTGDDTSGHQKPWENDDYDEINRALDPSRITCQADGVRSDAEYSAYHDYVTTTDVFMPEIYPLVRDTPAESRECASRVIRDMKRVYEDIREAKDARHHGVWPIIQAFDRAGWKHYPTRDELFAMTFVALCHGATGMTWYDYDCQCGVKNVLAEFPEAFPGRWADLTDLSKWIGELAPVLIERQTARDKVKVSICRGPQQDLYGYASISTRMHHKDGVAYLIAVNSAASEVEAEFAIGDRGWAEAMREERIFEVPQGKFRDVFKPLGVHVYKIGAAKPPMPPKALFADDFSSAKSDWKFNSLEKTYSCAFGAMRHAVKGLVVTGTRTNRYVVVDGKTNTIWAAWGARSPKIALPEKRARHYRFSFEAVSDKELGPTSEDWMLTWNNCVFWYDKNGDFLCRDRPCFRVAPGKVRRVSVTGRIPPDAVSFEVQLGFGGNLVAGESVVYRNLRMTESETMDEPHTPDRGDFSPPRVKMTSPSPTTDRRMKPAFRVTDETGVDWKTLKVTLDGKDATAGFTRQGDVFTWNGATDWKDGLHNVDVTAADTLGHAYTSRKRFFVGEAPKVPKVTLRDDGMTLVDGKPFFPIGLYGVMRRAENGKDFKKALEPLKEVGVNFVHSYGECRDPQFLAESERQGFMLWMETRLPQSWWVNDDRHLKNVLAWYLGDDTAGHEKPWELQDYDEATKAVDPNRITCQAESVRSLKEVSLYRDYVDGTDVFMPEIYPMVTDSQEENRECVARVLSDMRRICRDLREANDGRVHGIWPTIQCFRGYGWKHYPTRTELFGMTFAALVEGAHGITWYAYCGAYDPKTKDANMLTTKENWKDFGDLAKRIRDLVPILTERTGEQPSKPVVVSGPQTDPMGQGSMTCLFKRHEGAGYLFAVNSAAKPITVRFPMKEGVSVSVLFEDRSLVVGDDGMVDEFAPFGVHVYKMEGK